MSVSSSDARRFTLCALKECLLGFFLWLIMSGSSLLPSSIEFLYLLIIFIPDLLNLIALVGETFSLKDMIELRLLSGLGDFFAM
jgi:hypothetical protein